MIARSIGSLLAQDYPGDFRVILVDDNSDDGTGDVAPRGLDGRGPAGGDHRRAPCPPAGPASCGRMSQGVARAAARARPNYLLLTDADIAHAPENLRRLVARAEAGGLVLASLMARLHRGDLGRAAADPGLRVLLRTCSTPSPG